MANAVAKNGDTYLSVTAEPKGYNFKDIKKSAIDDKPNSPLNINNFLLFPKTEIFFRAK